jgi:hypothetical protein
MKNRTPLLAVLAVALLALPGCSSNTQGDDASPVYYSASFDLLPLEWNVGSYLPLQIQTTTLKSNLKNPLGGSSSYLDSRLEDYVVEWSRVDGGKKAPAAETFVGNVIVPAGGTSTLTDYPYMSRSALIASPLDQLLPFNGGIDRETGKSEIRCKATVTFRGRTLAGEPVRGTGSFGMTFLYSAATQSVVGRVN